MAETALYLALRKISLASRRDDDSSDSVILAMFQSRLRRIESELRMVHCFLDQRETRYSNNQVLVSWIAEAQRLGRLVEETVDVHIDRIFRPFGRTWRSQPGIPGLVLVALLPALLMKSIDARRRAFIQLTELEEELQHLSKMKKLWIQVANDPEAGYIPGISEMANLSNNQQLLSDFTDEETVAYDEERHELTRRLENSADGAHKVVAVWGPAGSGKTTFVRSVYEEQRSHFDCCAWITVSCCSSAEDVLNKMCRELCLEGKATITVGDHVRQSAEALMPDDLHIDHDTDQKPWKHLIEALRHSDLSEKKLLVVLDGVNVVIDGISEVLREIQWRSRIIIITRIKAVAEVVEGASIIKLAGLKEPKALELFQRMVGKGLDTSVEKKEIGMKIFHQCERLPQVIVSIGALLSLNQSTQSTFQQVQKQLGWVSKNNSILVGDTSKYLYVAYINLPKHLKVCLLYCGIFPAGHLLFRDNLVRLLVAEGFIEKQRPSEVDEEIAEEYLKVLTRLGFLQLVNCNEFGQVVSLRVPIVVHELVQSICRKEGFGIASDDFDLPQTDTNFRCLFTSKYPQDIHSLMQLRHVRTLIVSDSAAADSVIEKKKKVARYSNGIHLVLADDVASTIATALEAIAGVRKQNTFAYMTVLEFQGYPLKDVPRYIHFLINLRYLGLRKTEVRSLPREMKRLYNMQTLDLESSNITKLPNWIGELVRLRNLLAGCLIEENERKVLKGVGVAKSVRKLKDLYTLQTVEASPTFVKNVDMLTHLRNLRVSNVDRKSWRTLVDKISKLCSLTSFAVSAKGQNEVLDLDGYRLSFKQLKSLELSNCKLGEDPFKLLSNIFPNLVFLSLYGVSGIKKIEFEVNGFTKLRALNLREMTDVKKLQIPVGALASLEVLRVESLTELNVEDVGQLDKIRSIKKCFFPQLTHRLVTTDVPESSSRAAQL